MKNIIKNKETYGLFRNSYPENIREYLDMDLSNLSQTEAEWVSQFLLEYYNTSFKKDKSQWIHTDRSALWNPKNSRNRDLYAISSIPRDGYERGFLVFENAEKVEEEGFDDHYFTKEQVNHIYYISEDSMLSSLDSEEDVELSGSHPQLVTINYSLPSQDVVAKGTVFTNGAGFMVRDVEIQDTLGKKVFISSDEKIILVQSLIKERESQEDVKKNKKKVKRAAKQW